MIKILNTDGYQIYQEKFQVNELVAKVLTQYDDNMIKEIFSEQKEIDSNLISSIRNSRDLILDSIKKNEKIVICGDYDCDGICATTILVDAFKRLNYDVGFYICDRFKDGYGINEQIVEKFAQKDYKLIITVDNGVKAFSAIEKCQEKGIKLLICDHHLLANYPYENLLHPSNMEFEELNYLCGAGVSLKLVQSLVGKIDYHYVLASIATIADVMEVKGENRFIIKKGLELLNKNKYSFLNDLCPNKNITYKDLSFTIIPILNAVGRMADLVNCNVLVKMLLADKVDEATIKKLIAVNELRKNISNDIYSKICNRINLNSNFIIDKGNYHEGVIGLVCSKLTNKYHKVSIVCNEAKSEIKGSARAYDDVSLDKVFEKALPLLTKYGGHEKACGFSLKNENFDEFKKIIADNIINSRKEVIHNVYRAEANDLSVDNIMGLNILEPFGPGLEKPMFLFENCQVVQRSIIKNQHCKLKLNYQGIQLEALFFNDLGEDLDTNLTLIGSLGINIFNYRKNICLDQCLVIEK